MDTSSRNMPPDLIILGDAPCVWNDIERMGCASPGRNGTLKFDGEIMCVNSIGLHVESPDHWYSNDGKWLVKLHAARRPEWTKMFPGSIRLHSIMKTPGVEHWENISGPGSSGLNAIRIGLQLVTGKIFLCGIPLDDSGHNGDPHWKNSNFTREVAAQVDNPENRFWKTCRIREFSGRVVSMSGRTRDWLASP